jgi:hypothetical protein
MRSVPPADFVWCRSGDSTHACTCVKGRFEITPTSLSGIISASASHCGHQAQCEFRRRRTNRESVSIVILVRFAIASAFVRPANHLSGSTMAVCR